MILIPLQSWAEFKATVISGKSLPVQYAETDHDYELYAAEAGVFVWTYHLVKDSGADVTDWENNYKTSANKSMVAKDGRQIFRSDSRPRESTTVFTTIGDDTALGNGTELFWDFSNSDNLVTDSLTTTIPSGYKRKRMKITFADAIFIKEGTVYWKDAPKGCYLDFWVVCPSGQYYLTRAGTPTQASVDTPITHYVIKHRMFDTCAIGDELNTEGAAEDPLPTNYELWLEVTTPDTDSSSFGHCSIEVYRERTCLLPGEDL